jgi:hypothetical protein
MPSRQKQQTIHYLYGPPTDSQFCLYSDGASE